MEQTHSWDLYLFVCVINEVLSSGEHVFLIKGISFEKLTPCLFGIDAKKFVIIFM